MTQAYTETREEILSVLESMSPALAAWALMEMDENGKTPAEVLERFKKVVMKVANK